jgi:hypothetical protein
VIVTISRRHRFVLAAVFSIVVLALVPAALADKGGGGHKPGGGSAGSPGFTLVNVSSPGSLPSWGQQVTFTVESTATSAPNVSVTCSQNGTVVYGAVAGYYAWPWTNGLTLSSQAWTGGAASCTASLYYISGTSTVTLGSISFTAAA